MKQVYVLRHAPKDNKTNELTSEGRKNALAFKNKLPQFALIISSDRKRTQETAFLLTGENPQIDLRAGLMELTEEERDMLESHRDTNPFGYTGELYDTNALRLEMEKKAQELILLINKTLEKLDNNQKALIVSHDITMVPARQILEYGKIKPLSSIFQPLSGFVVNGKMEVMDFQF